MRQSTGPGRFRRSSILTAALSAALLTAIVDLAENWLGLQRLELVVFTDNNPAIALYKRFNFAVEGTLRQYAYRNGAIADVYTMARLAAAPEA